MLQKEKWNIGKIRNNAKWSDERKSKAIAKQQDRLEDIQTQRSMLSNLDQGITQLGESKTVYTFNTVEPSVTAALSSMTDGTVIINNYGTIGSRAHETTHAIQYDNKEIFFQKLGSDIATMRNVPSLEMRAYATEYSITGGIVPPSDNGSPRNVSGINIHWLYGLKNPATGKYQYTPENYK